MLSKSIRKAVFYGCHAYSIRSTGIFDPISHDWIGKTLSFKSIQQQFCNSKYLIPKAMQIYTFVYILQLSKPYMTKRTISQLLRPDLREKYTSTSSKFRSIGRGCIKQRIKALEANQAVPEDVLAKILSVVRKFYEYNNLFKMLSFKSISELFLYAYIKKKTKALTWRIW